MCTLLSGLQQTRLHSTTLQARLTQDFTGLLNNKVLYCDVAYKGLNRHNQHILEIVRVNFPQAVWIAVPEFSKCLEEIIANL